MKPITTLCGAAAALPLGNVDTDQIIPARFMSRSRSEGYGEQCFHDLRFDGAGRPHSDFALNALPRPPAVLVAGDNFGCGSSREAAVYALLDYGVQAVVSSSFADIFRSNAGKNGLLTIQLAEAELSRILAALKADPGKDAEVDLPAQTLRIGEMETMTFDIDAGLKHRLLNGLDDLSATLQNEDQIATFEGRYFANAPWVRPDPRS
ncbi:3-isopropylmalate dehydratase small subunit [Pseudooceanicola sediminis]|uniref:3-isopropylmalate dehydratase n=1 Tax=Pseudooceanicola sediminis TaxID=2211117 RepID=A0A399J163_9RHOB|nr:3-isopropylmalate dehydratase small subunit [Pseudooceanicola sediminis]KAA2312978.1 3-isopropylmalate dehydratase small subunit [Puniceibacterium sp. HSS470]RII37622.1 3-isopropylmalate dehydratase small subunit [Pseudooceanicola sediminis]|tara:strand:- start:26955 stop:27575 length:621 start_codon:yes stop_codon:yes gene_type:complete